MTTFLAAASIATSVFAAASSGQVVAVLAPINIPEHTSEVTIQVTLSPKEQELIRAVDSAHDLALDLDGIEALRSPGVYFELYLHSKSTPRGRSIGNLALFGTGIRSEKGRPFQAAHIQLTLVDDTRAALQRSAVLDLTFVASGAGGIPEPRSASALVIRKPSIMMTPRSRDRP